MKKNWRQTQWKDFEPTKKGWFIALCALLVVVLVMACLFTAEVVEVPNWLTVLVVAGMCFALYKFLQLAPWAFMADDPDDEEDDE